MKLGLMTAAFPDLTLEQVAEWSSANGFEMLEAACWPSGRGETRRYAGVCHIDVEALDADAVRETIARHGLEISSLGDLMRHEEIPSPCELHLRRRLVSLRRHRDPSARGG